MKIKFHHVNFCSTDVSSMDEFYRTVLDLQPEPSLETARVTASGYAGNVAFVSDGTTQLHLAERDLGVGFRTKHAINPLERGHIAFRTDDIVSFKQRLTEKGIPFSDYGAWAMNGWEQIFFHDPEGNVVEVHQDRSSEPAQIFSKTNVEEPMSAEQRLAALKIELPQPPKPIGNYVPFRIGGNLLFLSGVGPRAADGSAMTGKVGAELTVEQGYAAARLCGLNLLANMRAAAGSLDRVDAVLKVLGMVNATPDFGQHPEVINGCTDLFVQVLGESAGRPARSAVGMGSLPRQIAVEIEAVVLLRG